MTRRPTVLLVDDHVVFTEGVIRLLEGRFDVVGTAADGTLVLDLVSQLQPDVVVMDIAMPSLSGLQAQRRLKAKHEDIKVIFLTMHADPKLACEALRYGAKGFVLKQSSGSELIGALDAVL